MKRDFTHEDFEGFLKRSTDGLRMKAPDKVWQNLSRELNKKRRRFTIGLSAFLLVSSAVGYTVIGNLPQSEFTTKQPLQQADNETAAANNPNSTITPQQQTTSTTPVINLHDRSAQLPATTNSGNTARVIPFNNRSNSSDTELTTGRPTDHQLLVENTFTPTVVDSYTEFDQDETVKKSRSEPPVDSRATDLPLTIESVINSYKSKNKKNKFETQFYFTPTISYRKLTENKSYLRSLDQNAVPANFPALYSSVNNNVTHKPDIGFELGFTTKYALSNKLKIRSGLQFNVNRYDVKAFSSPISVAIIALNNGGAIDSFNTVSAYSNVNGYKSNWLQNLSFQLSVPVGAEFIVSENDDVAFGIAATVQPTYVLGDRAYLITTDYKSYTQVPSLIRRWNVNTALETFITLQSGNTKWQIGPQVRYQLLSSFISKYPVKENLFDFGLKVGVTLNNR
jgi:hypothetical protein